jgi:hypothetical protein
VIDLTELLRQLRLAPGYLRPGQQGRSTFGWQDTVRARPLNMSQGPRAAQMAAPGFFDERIQSGHTFGGGGSGMGLGARLPPGAQPGPRNNVQFRRVPQAGGTWTYQVVGAEPTDYEKNWIARGRPGAAGGITARPMSVQ